MKTNYELWKLHEKVTQAVADDKITVLEALAVYKEIFLRKELREELEEKADKEKREK